MWRDSMFMAMAVSGFYQLIFVADGGKEDISY
jgi:hypothetical protein